MSVEQLDETEVDSDSDALPNLMQPGQSPLMPDVGVIGLVPDLWNSPWMPRHQVLTRLGHYFHTVWMEPPKGWRELWLPAEADEDESEFDTSEFSDGYSIFRSGKWLPQLYRPEFLVQYLEKKRLQTIVKELRRKGCKTILLYLWRPEFLYSLDAVPHDVSFYHIDDEYSFSAVEQPMDPQEIAVMERVDQVIVHSPALMEKKGHLSPTTVLVPNGVDYNIFAQPRPEPKDLENIPHPRIGYVGVIKKQLDVDILLELARRHSDWSIVMVGPLGELGEDKVKYDSLREMQNVHFLGNKHRNEISGYMQHMDVCLMCYRIDDYTKFIYPLKLHEYLAGGRPVVASPIRSVQGFADWVQFASNADEWEQAIQTGLSPAETSPQRVEQRKQVAKKHDWNYLTQTIAELMCQRLGPDFVERFSSLSSDAQATRRSN